MRPSVLTFLVPLATANCDGKPVTGPEAQRVVAQAKSQQGTFTFGALVFVDGVRLSSDTSLEQIDPATVETVEIVKGAAASRLFGPDGERGVILITTTRAAATRAPPR